MRILLKGAKRSALLKEVARALEEKGVSYEMISCLKEGIEDYDFLLVVGEDRDVIRAFHEMGEHVIPVLGVSKVKEGFFIEVDVDRVGEVAERLSRGDYKIETSQRISVEVDGREAGPALNDVAVFPLRSATIMGYRLLANGELIWHDYSDGLLISTPLGSTAYAMSAGGPMIHPSARVFVIVPVNSLDVTRRPLVIPDRSTIEVTDITSRGSCYAIMDGIERVKVRDGVRVRRAEDPARLVRLPSISVIGDKIGKKVRLAEELLKLPPSAKLVLRTLQYEGPMGQEELLKRTMLPERTARAALSLLIEKKLVKRQRALRDARRLIYYAL